jgi:hypothetical protein
MKEINKILRRAYKGGNEVILYVDCLPWGDAVGYGNSSTGKMTGAMYAIRVHAEVRTMTEKDREHYEAIDARRKEKGDL